MSISKMKKLVVIAPTESADAVIAKLMSLRCVDIREFSSDDTDNLIKKVNYDEQIAQAQENIQKIESVISSLYKYSNKKSRLSNKRACVDRCAFLESGDYDAVIDLVWKEYDLIAQLDEANENKEVYDNLVNEIKSVSYDLNKIEALYDIEMTNLLTLRAKEKTSVSESCTFIHGWVPKKAQEKVEEALSEYVCAFEFEEPTEDDEPPVSLSNNPITRAFEWLVSGIVCPKYRSFDPTFITSIFYFLAFGLMLPDIGYGAILVLFGLLGAKLFGLRGRIKEVFNMLGWCGFSSMIFGVLLGSWFGDIPYAIMQNILGIEKASEVFPLFGGVWFNHLQKPVYYLVVTLALGAIQILVGMILKFVLLCKEGKAVDALLDIAPWWVIFAGIALAFTVNLPVGLIVIGVGVLAVLLFAGRAKATLSAKIKGGLLGLCKIGLYAIDLLGFLKIFVLGVSVAMITHWINMLATIMGASTIGYVIFVAVCIVCHGICFCIGSFVAFLIANSLQRNEFFKQFLIDGGDRFAPVSVMEKYTIDSCKK